MTGEPKLIDYLSGEPMCRCVPCCCKPGTGHRSEGYRRWERAMQRWEDERGRGSGATPSSD